MKSLKKPITTLFQKEIAADQIKWLFKQSQITIGYNLGVAIFLTVIFWSVEKHLFITIWFIYLASTLLIRFIIVKSYKAAHPAVEQITFWGKLHGIAILLTGTAWGMVGIMLYSNAVEYQAFLAFVLAGMASGAIAVFSAVLPIAISYLIILLLPFTIRLGLEDDPMHWAMAALVLLFTISVIQVTRGINSAIKNAISLKFQNQDLINELSTEKEQIVSLNVELQIRNKAMEASTDGIIIIKSEHPDYPIIYANQAFEKITSLSFAEIKGKSCFFLEDTSDPSNFMPIRTALYNQKSGTTLLHQYKKNGEPIWVELHVSPVINSDKTISYFVGSLWDVSAHKHLEERLAYQATHDELTKLPNRALVFDRLQQAIVKAERVHNMFGVIFCDIDHFKNVNDQYGHNVGDELLRAYTARLCSCLRQSDTVGRLGGDEFLILISPIKDKADLVNLTQKILATANKSYDLKEKTLNITSSIGIAMYPQDGTSPGTLLSNADLALYRCKEAGRNNFMFYNE